MNVDGLRWILAAILVIVGAGTYMRRSKPVSVLPAGPYAAATTVLETKVLFSQGQRLRPRIEIWYPTDPDPRTPATPTSSASLSSARARWPLLLYFPGWPGTEIQNRFLLRDLVSQGFLVAAVTYPEASALPALNYSDARAANRSLEEFDQRVRDGSRDATAMLDGFARIDGQEGGWLSHRIDFTRVGIMGFSWGGSVAVHAYWADARLGAAVLLDQNHWLDAPQRPNTCKLLLLSEAQVGPTAAELRSNRPEVRNLAVFDQTDTDNMLRQFHQHGGIQVLVTDTVHVDFTDRVMAPSLRLRLRSSISPRRKLTIIETYVVTYLDWAFLGSGRTLPPDRGSRFPEVKVLDFRGEAHCKG